MVVVVIGQGWGAGVVDSVIIDTTVRGVVVIAAVASEHVADGVVIVITIGRH